MTLFAIVFAILLNSIRRSRVSSSDTVISVFSSTAVALGLVLLSSGGGFSKYSSYLIGDILTIRPAEIAILAVVLVLTLIFWIFCFNKLLQISVNSTLASSPGGSGEDHGADFYPGHRRDRHHLHPLGRDSHHQFPADPPRRRQPQRSPQHGASIICSPCCFLWRQG